MPFRGTDDETFGNALRWWMFELLKRVLYLLEFAVLNGTRLWVIAYAAMSLYAINYHLCWLSLMTPAETTSLQADEDIEEHGLRDSQGRLRWDVFYRPRQCQKQNCDKKQSDRVFHCTRFRRDLPVYDQFCTYTGTFVYLRTIKPYLYMLFFLVVDALSTLSVCIVAMTKYSVWSLAPFIGSVIVTAVVLVKYVFMMFMVKDADGIPYSQCHKFDENPWNLGVKRNLLQVFGRSPWEWIFFFLQPERVHSYGNEEVSDLPFNDAVLAFYERILVPDVGAQLESLEPALIDPRGQQQHRESSERPSQAQTAAATSSTHGEVLHSKKAKRLHICCIGVVVVEGLEVVRSGCGQYANPSGSRDHATRRNRRSSAPPYGSLEP
ncbi:Uu.00g069850.m01.CDS01 [Anthostomella pinea]|uniref:Uu.00g069850.m01.CDS01 n=1 Tax=Anthostomella pinea TaxID=933095 RepID=A0AAI8YNN1_9PEZI|nr:Uu.00g069850.m01.CDS01 [Anthostomella pinea]